MSATASGHIRGNDLGPYAWDGEQWLDKNSEPLNRDMPCRKCHLRPTVEGYDACLGEIPGAAQACCGHGSMPGYVLYAVGGEPEEIGPDRPPSGWYVFGTHKHWRDRPRLEYLGRDSLGVPLWERPTGGDIETAKSRHIKTQAETIRRLRTDLASLQKDDGPPRSECVTTTITLEPPAKHINANHRLHFHTKNDLTQKWRKAAESAIDALGTHRPIYERAHIVVAYRFPTNHRREVANLQPTSKAIVDGLVDAGVLPDDDDMHCIGPDNRRHIPNGPALVTITIQEIS